MLLIAAAAAAVALCAGHSKPGSQPAQAPAYPVCFTFDPLKAASVSRAMMAREGRRLLISLTQSDQKKSGCVLRVDNSQPDKMKSGLPRVFVNVKALASNSSKIVLVRVVAGEKSATIYIEPLS